jgi:hypothetical protein
VAYQAATGTRAWVVRYRPENVGGIAESLAVSGTKVFVTGFVTREARSDYATIAYRAATGATLWTANYNGPAGIGDAAFAIAATPALVFVTGVSDIGPRSDYATIAYTP